MPWVDQNKCTGCAICVEKCPVNAISLSDLHAGMKNKSARINMAECIRCGICHNVCPQEAVRHDSEKIPECISSNVEATKKNMVLCVKYLGDDNEGSKCLERTKKYFKKEKLVAEETLKKLEEISN